MIDSVEIDYSTGSFLVFHNTNKNLPIKPDTGLWFNEIAKIEKTGLTGENPDRNFRLVALVSNASPEEVFEITQHQETDWTQHPQVLRFTNTPQRSTSVGDVILRVGITKLEFALMVGSTGFIKLANCD